MTERRDSRRDAAWWAERGRRMAEETDAPPPLPPTSVPPASSPPKRPETRRTHVRPPVGDAGVRVRRRRARARVQARAHALRARDERYLQRLRARLIADGLDLMSANRARLIPFKLWLLCAMVIADRSGRAARAELAKLKNRAAAGAILRASIAPEQRAERRSWADLRTRRIAALGLAIVHLAQPTRRRDQWGGGIVRGIARGALCALLRDVMDRRPTATPSVSALRGVHRPGGSADNGQIGYLDALEAAGLLYSQQLPASEAGRDEVGPSGWAMNRYWLVTGVWELAAEWARETFASWLELAQRDASELRRVVFGGEGSTARAGPAARAAPA